MKITILDQNRKELYSMDVDNIVTLEKTEQGDCVLHVKN